MTVFQVDFNMLGHDGKTVPTVIRVGDKVDLFDPDVSDGPIEGTVRAVHLRKDAVVLDVEPL